MKFVANLQMLVFQCLTIFKANKVFNSVFLQGSDFMITSS
jgi:hypothetical protein